MIRRALPAAVLALLLLWAPGLSIAAQTYRTIDHGRSAVTLPAATGLPTITTMVAAPGAGFSILHARDGNIHHFDANGRLLRRYGRASDSSVAFVRLYNHGWHGRSPWAFELNNKAITVFDGSTGRISTTIDLPRHGPARVEALTPNGAPIVYSHFRNAEGADPQYRYGYALLPGFGMPARSPFATLPSDACDIRLGEVWAPIAWCQQVHGAVAPNGEWSAVVVSAMSSDAGEQVVRVVFLSSRGDTLSQARVAVPRVAVSRAEAEKQLMAEARSRRLNAAHARLFREAVAAEPSYPIASWLFATNDRTLWLVQQTDLATRYLVINTAGQVVGRYATAANLRLMAAAGTTAFGVRELAQGRQEVVRVGF